MIQVAQVFKHCLYECIGNYTDDFVSISVSPVAYISVRPTSHTIKVTSPQHFRYLNYSLLLH